MTVAGTLKLFTKRLRQVNDTVDVLETWKNLTERWLSSMKGHINPFAVTSAMR
jgi:hypothetical protein